MKNNIFYALIFSIFFSVSPSMTFSSDRLIYIGGADNSGEDKTIFDNGVKKFSQFYQRSKHQYKTTVAFNGGHSYTTKLINDKFKGADIKSEGFTESNFNSILENALEEMNSKNPPKKMLIFLDTHGFKAKDEQGTHTISLTDGEISLDALKELSDLALTKGINLAIIDNSCHSGASLSLANSKTCVISASSPNQYADNDFPEAFSENMKPGQNLEAVFLKTRQEVKGNPFPMISTDVGIKVQKEFSNLLPYLTFHDKSEGVVLDKIDDYLLKNATPLLMCQRENQFAELMKMIEQLEKLISRHSPKNLSQLKFYLDAYKKVQDEYLKKMSLLEINNEQLSKEKLCIGNKYRIGMSYSVKNLLQTNFDKLISDSQHDLSKTKNNETIETIKSEIDLYEQCRKLKENTLTEDPKLKKIANILEELGSDERLLEKNAEVIGHEARRAYHDYYNFLDKSTEHKTNPCREFVL